MPSQQLITFFNSQDEVDFEKAVLSEFPEIVFFTLREVQLGGAIPKANLASCKDRHIRIVNLALPTNARLRNESRDKAAWWGAFTIQFYRSTEKSVETPVGIAECLTEGEVNYATKEPTGPAIACGTRILKIVERMSTRIDSVAPEESNAVILRRLPKARAGHHAASWSNSDSRRYLQWGGQIYCKPTSPG